MLGNFVPVRVVDRLVANASAVDRVRERAFAACLITDAQGYVRQAEHADASSLAGRLNEYFASINAAVAQHGGVVVDITGDAVLALWSEATESRRSRVAACDAALELLRNVDAFNQRSPDFRLPTRIGLDYGPVALGPVGAAGFWQYRPVGSAVNTASRIEQHNRRLGTQLLVSEAVVAGLDEFCLRPVGSFVFHNRTEAVSLFELIARREAASPLQITLCQATANALQHFRLQRSDAAEAEFAALLRAYPNDGVAQFYLQLCRDGQRRRDGEIVIDGLVLK